MALPPYIIDANPFAQSFNALGQGVDQLGAAMGQARKRENNLVVTNALANRDYAAAMRASDSPEMALGIQRAQYGQQENADAAAFREREFALRQQEAQRQARQFQMQYEAQQPGQQADIAYKQAQARALGQKDEIRAGIGKMLFGDDGGQGGMPTGQPPATLQPQSNAAPQPMPGVQLAQNVPPQGQGMPPIAPQSPAQAQEPTVEVFGRKMPVGKARLLAQSMMMDPQYAPLGKSILDGIPAQTGAIGKEGMNELDKKQIAATDQVGRLREIERQFKPEFMQIETRAGLRWTEFVDSFKAGKLSSEAQKELGEYSAFRSEALNNLNQYIKEITGAAMSVAEADRIKKVMPNPGEGIFDGDSPTVFKAKLDQAMKQTKLSIARQNFLRKRGFNGTVEEASNQLPLERMNDVIQQRTDSILQETMAANPGVDENALKPLVKQRMRAEFGIYS